MIRLHWPRRARATCPVCTLQQRLCHDGTLRRHFDLTAPTFGPWPPLCPGGGQPPHTPTGAAS